MEIEAILKRLSLWIQPAGDDGVGDPLNGSHLGGRTHIDMMRLRGRQGFIIGASTSFKCQSAASIMINSGIANGIWWMALWALSVTA